LQTEYQTWLTYRKESHTGVITLEDDSEYLNAIDCMVSYFYQAAYDCSEYTTSESLLHAQVAILADKYVCHSLYNLARTCFSKTIEDVGTDDWGVIAAFVYDYTTTEVPAHIELRDIVVGAVTGRHSVLQATLQNPSNVELLRSDADLATDLLLGGRHGSRARAVSEHHFVCGHCHYSHAGSHMCPNVMCKKACPSCGKRSEKGTNNGRKVGMLPAFSCPACDGFHSQEPEPVPEVDHE
jgi:hypothetical protein